MNEDHKRVISIKRNSRNAKAANSIEASTIETNAIETNAIETNAIERHSLATNTRPQLPWVVLVVDDDQSVLDVTYNVLKRFVFKQRGLRIECANSLEKAKDIYHQLPDVAVAIVDCAMEEETSGLDFIKYIRDECKDLAIQLVLRTGQPELAPEHDVLLKYDINDYLAKTELTSIRLKHRMMSYLRAYDNISTIVDQNNKLHEANREIQYKNHELIELDKVKDNLLSMISHDLRSPVASIEWLLDLMSMELEGESYSPEKMRERLSLMFGGLQRIKTLTSDLVDSVMIRRNAFRMSFACVDIYQLIDELMPNFDAYAKHVGCYNQVAIKNHIPQGLPNVYGDKVRIAQVIINLVNNALKFTSSGSVLVSAELVPAYIRVSVKDTGLGIHADDIEVIFDMFTQAKSTKDEVSGGMGLGLFVANKIVAMHNGAISVSSTPNIGSTFAFTVPLAS